MVLSNIAAISKRSPQHPTSSNLEPDEQQLGDHAGFQFPQIITRSLRRSEWAYNRQKLQNFFLGHTVSHLS